MSRAPQRVLVLGCGSVAQAAVPLLIRDLGIEPARVTVVDMVDNRDPRARRQDPDTPWGLVSFARIVSIGSATTC